MKILILLVLAFVFAANAVTPKTGGYSLSGLGVTRDIFKHSSVSFAVVSFQEEEPNGTVVHSADVSSFSDFSAWTEEAFGPNGTLYSTYASFLDKQSGESGTITLNVFYTEVAVSLDISGMEIDLPSDSIKSEYVLDWPVSGPNFNDKLVITIKASWDIDFRDILDVASDPSYEPIYDSDGKTEIGINITKPFTLSVFWPRNVYVGTTAVKLSFSGSVGLTSASITITIPGVDSTITVDPVLKISSVANIFQASLSLFVLVLIALLLL